MYPIICQIGSLTVYSYGFMLAVAVFVCTYFLQKEAKRKNINPDTVVDLVFWIIAGGIVGCRIFYIFLNLSFFIENPSEIFMIHHGGLAWQGGLILGAATAFVLIRRKGLPVLGTLDLFVPYLALGQAIGRIGCFLNGCCYGKEVSWGIYFPVHHARLQPTQLYSALGLLALFFVLKKYNESHKKAGETFVFYLILASLLRFTVEFFRADHTNVFFGLSIFQIVCLCIMMAALYVKSSLSKS